MNTFTLITIILSLAANIVLLSFTFYLQQLLRKAATVIALLTTNPDIKTQMQYLKAMEDNNNG